MGSIKTYELKWETPNPKSNCLNSIEVVDDPRFFLKLVLACKDEILSSNITGLSLLDDVEFAITQIESTSNHENPSQVLFLNNIKELCSKKNSSQQASNSNEQTSSEICLASPDDAEKTKPAKSRPHTLEWKGPVCKKYKISIYDPHLFLTVIDSFYTDNEAFYTTQNALSIYRAILKQHESQLKENSSAIDKFFPLLIDRLPIKQFSFFIEAISLELKKIWEKFVDDFNRFIQDKIEVLENLDVLLPALKSQPDQLLKNIRQIRANSDTKESYIFSFIKRLEMEIKERNTSYRKVLLSMLAKKIKSSSLNQVEVNKIIDYLTNHSEKHEVALLVALFMKAENKLEEGILPVEKSDLVQFLKRHLQFKISIQSGIRRNEWPDDASRKENTKNRINELEKENPFRRMTFMWVGSEIPECYKENIRKFKQYNPDYQLEVWYVSDLLNDEQKTAMQDFCKSEQINLLDLKDYAYDNENNLIESLSLSKEYGPLAYGLFTDLLAQTELVSGLYFLDWDLIFKGKFPEIDFSRNSVFCCAEVLEDDYHLPSKSILFLSPAEAKTFKETYLKLTTKMLQYFSEDLVTVKLEFEKLARESGCDIDCTTKQGRNPGDADKVLYISGPKMLELVLKIMKIDLNKDTTIAFNLQYPNCITDNRDEAWVPGKLTRLIFNHMLKKAGNANDRKEAIHNTVRSIIGGIFDNIVTSKTPSSDYSNMKSGYVPK